VITPSFGVSRTFDTSLERLWAAFTVEDELAAWYMPPDSQVLLSRMELSGGGTYRYGLETPDGVTLWGQWDIHRVEPPELLTFVQYATDARGDLAPSPNGPDWPRKLRSEVRCALQGGGATVTINLSPLDPTESEVKAFRAAFAALSQGWERALDALDVRLTKP
jgi:uncharacterized protein YndB with AHSA1/START domain